MRTALAVLLCAAAAPAQDKPDAKGFDTVDPVKVSQAIQKGCEYLKTSASPGAHRGIKNCNELIALTLIEGGVPVGDPVVQKHLQERVTAPLERTYNAVLTAMVLEEVHRVKYQDRIWQCAQFLVDNQCPNGQWAYGEPTEAIKNGMAWLGANWSVTENKGPAEVHEGAPNAYVYYYLYAVERLGMLYDTGKIGGRFWYADGAKVLLEAQKPDGSWDASEPRQPPWDTCFAILFLKRATRPLIATEAGGGKK
ncbi:MAG TPA: hypothetical protein VJB14_10135 [Planctomycetota bacterium]|nr:hypothetical protein [Planctomycetota bacterium]